MGAQCVYQRFSCSRNDTTVFVEVRLHFVFWVPNYSLICFVLAEFRAAAWLLLVSVSAKLLWLVKHLSYSLIWRLFLLFESFGGHEHVWAVKMKNDLIWPRVSDLSWKVCSDSKVSEALRDWRQHLQKRLTNLLVQCLIYPRSVLYERAFWGETDQGRQDTGWPSSARVPL